MYVYVSKLSFLNSKVTKSRLFIDTGWGRAHKTAIQKWYAQFETNPDNLARLVTKFKNREGWTHKDVLRLSHPVPGTASTGYIFRLVSINPLYTNGLFLLV